MTRDAEVSVQEPPKDSVWVACASCDRSTAHRVLTCVRLYDSVLEADIQIWETYLTLQCQGCLTVSFCRQSQNTEDTTYNTQSGQEELVTTTKLYPCRIAGRPEMEGLWEAPFGVVMIYRETHAALASDQPILAGIGIRAIVEAICTENAASGANLEARIDDLATQGWITRDGAAILHALRFMGNSAAHATKAHTQEELHTAFEVVEYLIGGVYVLKSKAEKLPKAPTKTK